jgi:outer membrane protein assembly factor BamB
MKLGNGYGAPTISKGRLFIFDRIDDGARLRCLKSETGELLWRFDYPTSYQDDYNYNNGPRCCPVVDDNRVYIFGAEGMLHCLSAADGKLLWKVDTQAEYGVIQNFFGVGSTPVVEGNLLIVQVGGSPKGEKRSLDQKGNGSAVVAFDKLTGKVKYRVGNELASYASPVLATIDKERWCFIFARGGLFGLDPVSGKERFHFPWRASILESVNASNPLVIGDKILISETYGPGSALLQIKSDSPHVVWKDEPRARLKILQCHWNTPIYHDGYVYGCSGRHTQNADLRCIELATGKIMWRKPALTRTSLMMVDGHFICLGEDGELRLLKVDPKKYDEVAHMETGLEYPCWAAPVLSHGLLYLRGADRLVCLEVIVDRK